MEYLNVLYGKALDSYKKTDDLKKVWETSILMASTEYSLGNFGEAQELLQRAGAIRELAGEPRGWLNSLNEEIGGRKNYRNFEDLNEIKGWVKYPEPGTTMSINATTDSMGTALQVDYDLRSKSWIQFYKVFNAVVPRDGVFKFKLKWKGNKNNFEFKVVDRNNTNYRKVFELPGKEEEWQEIAIPISSLKYWQFGNGILDLDHVRALWLAISKGNGGKGSIEIRDFRLVK